MDHMTMRHITKSSQVSTEGTRNDERKDRSTDRKCLLTHRMRLNSTPARYGANQNTEKMDEMSTALPR